MPESAVPNPAVYAINLVPVAGPRIDPLRIIFRDDRPEGITLGRHETCDLTLPASAEKVSRFHARFRFDVDSARWRIADLGSTWCTYLNGVKLEPQREVPIGQGDLLRIEPWTFSVESSLRRQGVMSADDEGRSIIRKFDAVTGPPQPLREDILALLMEAAASIHDAKTELELAERLLDAAVRGSGLPNAAVIRLLDNDGRVDVIAARSGNAGASAHFRFSRSLLSAAAGGQTAELSGGMDPSQSIIQMNIASAMCVPLMLGGAPAAFLYLDARGPAGRSALTPSNATAFCSALGRLAGLALSNLKRMEVERRQVAIEHDLTAAAAAQRWVLPHRETRIGSIHVTGECRPGRYVGGDFFDLVDLGDGKVAVTLGDVAGKGVEASVLMTATQGFLHAALLHLRDPGAAVTATNRFLVPRRPVSRFVTLWAGVIDTAANTLSFVDAGHGHAVLTGKTHERADLMTGGGPPLGLDKDFAYSTEVVALPKNGRLVVVSDGIVEQTSGAGDSAGARAQFGIAGVQFSLASARSDDIAELFARVVEHAGTNQLADDATAVCVRWDSATGGTST